MLAASSVAAQPLPDSLFAEMRWRMIGHQIHVIVDWFDDLRRRVPSEADPW